MIKFNTTERVFVKTTYLIVGASAAGVAASSKLRQLDADARIVCISDEQEFPYNKCFLVDYLSKQKKYEQLSLKPQDFFKTNNIDLRLNTRVVSVDAQLKQVTCQDGSKIEYTKLLLATGGSITLPSIKGNEGVQGVMPFYNMHDTTQIEQWITRPTTKKVIVIGAGLSGMECVDALLGYDISLAVVDRASQVLGRQTDDDGAAFICKKAEIAGVSFHFNTSVAKVISAGGVIAGVELIDGTYLEADMLICALGARPNLGLAKSACIAVDQGGVVTNQWLQTTNESIYAAGDITLVLNKLTGKKMVSCTWPDALVQGMTVATNMIEHTKPYGGVSFITASHFFDLSFHVAGVFEPQSVTDHVNISSNEDFYQKIVFDKNKLVRGFLLIGHTQHLSSLKRALLTQSPFDMDSLKLI
jgi:NAD(P)H-nitrite reductase large subunit